MPRKRKPNSIRALRETEVTLSDHDTILSHWDILPGGVIRVNELIDRVRTCEALGYLLTVRLDPETNGLYCAALPEVLRRVGA